MKNPLNSLRFRLKALWGDSSTQQPADRCVKVRAQDKWIVSYPKSGNTWTRFLIANIVTPCRDVDFSNISELVPDIHQESSKKLAEARSIRTLKSHEYFDPRYQKVLYIVRDPRDVAVSYYHHHLKTRTIDKSTSIEDFAEAFLKGELDDYGSWGENVGSWIGAKSTKSKDFLITRYEDLLANTIAEMQRIADHLEINTSKNLIERAVQRSSFENMQRLENNASDVFSMTRVDLNFVRKGKSGGWRKDLPPSFTNRITHAWGNQMRQLGYLE